MTLHLSYGAQASSVRALACYRKIKRLSLLLALAAALAFPAGCMIDERRSGIPSAAQDVIDIFTEDFNRGRFDKIYREASDEWRGRVTQEQSDETFRRLKEGLGEIKERTYTSGRQQQNSGGNLPVSSLVVRYNTRFERAEGIETFTLLERDGRYVIAGYSVNSSVLRATE